MILPGPSFERVARLQNIKGPRLRLGVLGQADLVEICAAAGAHPGAQVSVSGEGDGALAGQVVARRCAG